MPQTHLDDALHQLLHTYKNQLKKGIRDHGIDLPVTHIRVLKGVRRLDHCTAGLIAQRMDRDKAQITRVVHGLLAAGLIEKRDNPADQRSQLLTPTTTGQQILHSLELIEANAVAQLTHNLSDRDLAAFRRISTIMINNAPTAAKR